MAPDRIERDVAWLSDDAREGRGVDTRGLAAAADHIAREFEAAGFEPGGTDGDWLQRFEMTVGIEVADAHLGAADLSFERGEDFEALLTSESGAATGRLVFAGYGISAKKLGFDEYTDLDVEGAVVLLLEDRPRGDDSPLSGRGGVGFLRRAHKIANARRRGAAAVLIAPSERETEALPSPPGMGANPMLRPAGILTLAVSRATAAKLVDANGGPSLDERQDEIDRVGRPASSVLAGEVSVSVEIAREQGDVFNVIGLRRGADPALARQAVVIGAHYDHLGRGEFGSLAPSRRGEIHNGADDNASGTAGLLELARAFGREPPPPRTLVLAAFTAEESGLRGSAEYVRDPVVPMSDTVAMLNLDMVGRLRDGGLTVFGADTSPGFTRLVRAAASELDTKPVFHGGGYAPSDQTSFYAKNIPVLLFFTGSHSEYHTPDDEFERVDTDGVASVAGVVYRVARALLDGRDRPLVVTAAAPDRGSSGGGYGPYLGTVPDFSSPSEGGVLLQGVRAGSPAEVAGIRAGDRIVEFDGASVANLEEYAALLFSARPGHSVAIVVVRDGERITTLPTLGRRR